MQKPRLSVTSDQMLFYNERNHPDLVVQQDGYKVFYSEKHSTKKCSETEKRGFTLFCLFINFCRTHKIEGSHHPIISFTTNFHDLARFTGINTKDILPSLIDLRGMRLIEIFPVTGKINFQSEIEIVIAADGLSIASSIYGLLDNRTFPMEICPEIQFYDTPIPGDQDEKNKKINKRVN